MGKRRRFAVLRRDGFRCRYCGASADERQLHVDHVLPVVRGGDNSMSNLVAACVDCNLGKAAQQLPPARIDVEPKSRHWAIAAEKLEDATDLVELVGRDAALEALARTAVLFELTLLQGTLS